jgi:hypothetical protein
MQIERVDLASAATRRACHEVYVAALQADQAEGPWLSAGRFGNWLTAGWVGNPSEAWLVHAGTDPEPDGGMSPGAIAGWYRLELPDRENLDQARLELRVHPDRRRRGQARRAARAGRAGGRRLLAGVMDRAGAR